MSSYLFQNLNFLSKLKPNCCEGNEYGDGLDHFKKTFEVGQLFATEKKWNGYAVHDALDGDGQPAVQSVEEDVNPCRD